MGGGGSPDSAQQARPARNWDALRRRSAVRLRGRPSYVVHAAALVHDRITADEVVEAVQVLALPQAPGLLRLSAEQRSRPAPTQGSFSLFLLWLRTRQGSNLSDGSEENQKRKHRSRAIAIGGHGEK
ncbi:uncharacterized protein LOC112344310 isoform X3 [Selaginella moellendorffii]|uniref:uncharacterized protein LOC112344310 isoform X3 n=1 Tax=Selaginella moellendorffii TaxID=88036 RepID=UPI000D1D0162|nr:uncharacterized protein LOC112344310 isoform X3 [Selaginella moellendorffii]|eukprot:XP_024524533.1 uncharacterized protein LOC112344310 isoform X3 [Selaginella moellendorffii]